jgi:hypothetical protein
MAAETVEVGRHMRPVQCDGFLMEWREADARPLASVPGATWDAANTADGLAGYVRAAARDSCDPAGVVLGLSGPQRSELLGLLRFDGTSQGLAVSAVNRAEQAEHALEFVLPWNSLALDSTGCYGVVLSVFTSCDSTAGAVRLAGCRGTLAARVITPRIKTQIAVIAVLLAAYVVMSLRLRRKRTDRTQ